MARVRSSIFEPRRKAPRRAPRSHAHAFQLPPGTAENVAITRPAVSSTCAAPSEASPGHLDLGGPVDHARAVRIVGEHHRRGDIDMAPGPRAVARTVASFGSWRSTYSRSTTIGALKNRRGPWRAPETVRPPATRSGAAREAGRHPLRIHEERPHRRTRRADLGTALEPHVAAPGPQRRGAAPSGNPGPAFDHRGQPHASVAGDHGPPVHFRQEAPIRPDPGATNNWLRSHATSAPRDANTRGGRGSNATAGARPSARGWPGTPPGRAARRAPPRGRLPRTDPRGRRCSLGHDGHAQPVGGGLHRVDEGSDPFDVMAEMGNERNVCARGPSVHLHWPAGVHKLDVADPVAVHRGPERIEHSR